jgi:hypothetical protein
MKRVLFTQFSLQPPGGGNGVAVWMLEALKDSCRVTVLAFEKPDLTSINRYFGTTLRPTDFDLVWPPGGSSGLHQGYPRPSPCEGSLLVLAMPSAGTPI